MIDPTTLLAELAAIQRDVKTLAECHILVLPQTSEWCRGVVANIGKLMSSIAAPPPVDNGMLAPIRARLDELERKVESLTKSAEGYEWAVGMGHHIKALVGRHIFIDGGDPGDEQEAS